MIVSCTECGKEIIRPQSLLKNRRPFCGRECYKKDWIRRMAEKNNKGNWFDSICPVCGKTFVNGKKGVIAQRCSKACANKANAHNGETNPSWKGGKQVAQNGYITVYTPGHPRAHKNHVREHVLVAEKALGKPLPKGAVVHHHNKITSDNRNNNLVICQDQSYHNILHSRMRKIAKKAA
jgi:endogenous inhibitor of DNA gyrase (YacG/DUF329 family)